MRKNQNWFNAMVEFRNTINNIRSYFGVRSDVVAAQIQHVACLHQDQYLCEQIAKAHFELTSQVGF